jgi:leader peptidase (prepilin peptidase)/N-methyltransferase
MIPELIPIYIVIFLFGIVIGSFLNVCIFRIPNHETVVTERSHCMRCGYQLSWYDMVPVFSWLFLRGRCRKCKEPISPQYPIIEAAMACSTCWYLL